MKIAPEVYAEIIDIVLHGLSTGEDVSQRMRDLDLKEDQDRQLVTFTDEWLKRNPRADV